MRIPVVLLVVCLTSPAARAAEPDDPAADARLHLGPLAVTPRLVVRDVGVDSNVFREVEADGPASDFTATVGPVVDSWLRVGPARLTLANRVDFVYFHRYADERSVNMQHQLKVEVPLSRVTPWLSGATTSTRERPGFEIDARARRFEHTSRAGVDVTVSDRSVVGIAARRTVYDFDADAVFQGSSLRDVLNRESTGAGASIRYEVTPVTALVVTTDVSRDRFERSPARDADSVRIDPAVEFDGFLTGRASVGYRRMTFRTPGLPDYAGAVASVDLAHTFLSTRVAVGVRRDVGFSFEIAEPYYVETGASLSVTQQLAARWDAVGRVGRFGLAYRSTGPTPDMSGRLDRVETFGGGLGYRFIDGLRLGMNVDFYHRESAIARRNYRGLLVGSSVTYGF